MNRFLECLEVVDSPEVEGGFSNHPDDHGGPTDRGITQETYDEYRDNTGQERRPVKGVGDTEVQAIYMRYWTNAFCDAMPAPLDMLVFDVAINSGPKKAIVLLQRALGMEPHYQTGYFGPLTAELLTAATEDFGVMSVCDKYLEARVTFYYNRVKLEPSQADFLNGWLNRVQHMAKVIGLNRDYQ